ncbi:MAG: hypothetical protein V1775_17000 [Bacteroidota bacterium]
MKDYSGFIQKHLFNIPFLFLFILPVLPSLTLKAQTSGSKKKINLKTDFSMNAFYDNNILKYSEKYISRFINNEDEGRFHIKTYDDVIMSPEIELIAGYQLFRKLNTTLTAGYKNTSYVVNNTKNRNYFYCGLRQNISKKASFKISYTYIPYFYIRHFRDDDLVEVFGYTPESFRPFSFSKDNFSAEFQNTFLKNTRIRLIIDYSKYYYNEYFTEYDSDDKSIEINLRQPLHKNLRFEAGYSYTASESKGFDEPGETRKNSEDSDGSYVEDGFLLRVMWTLPYLKNHKNALNVKGEFGRRCFTSEKSTTIDPLHAGRVDKNLLLNATYSFEISESFELTLFYNWFSRKASSVAEENKQYISDEKDYNQSQVGLTLTYSIKL